MYTLDSTCNFVGSFSTCAIGDDDTRYNDRLINKNLDLKDVIYMDNGVEDFNVDITIIGNHSHGSQSSADHASLFYRGLR